MKNKKVFDFKKAVEATEDIATCYKVGLTALGSYSDRVVVSDTSKLQGSVDIDSCTTAKYPNANRWDYALAYKSEIYYVEVHSANTAEVDTMIRKLEWLKQWLRTEAPEINKLTAKQNAFVWIQSKNFQILKTSPQYRRAKRVGLLPVRILNLN
jgi:hypothetical protein